MIMNIGFYLPYCNERGTIVATYDYAYNNERVLGNKSYIIHKSDIDISCKEMYNIIERDLEIIKYKNNEELNEKIKKNNISHLYYLIHGRETLDKFKDIDVKLCIHCVFRYKNSKYYHRCASISPIVKCNNYSNPYVEHINDLPRYKHNEDLRDLLEIPKEALVIGRYGGYDTFNIDYVKKCIIDHVNKRNDIYFIFLNTYNFCKGKCGTETIFIHRGIKRKNNNKTIFLRGTYSKPEDKIRFINTCDMMIHGKLAGETFGLSVAEFSSMNKPIITSRNGSKWHIIKLGEKGIVKDSYEELMEYFVNLDKSKLVGDWQCYKDCNSESIMLKFRKEFLE